MFTNEFNTFKAENRFWSIKLPFGRMGFQIDRIDRSFGRVGLPIGRTVSTINRSNGVADRSDDGIDRSNGNTIRPDGMERFQKVSKG